MEWAVQELVDGQDSPALKSLAAHSRPLYWSEVEQDFQAVLDELGIAHPSREACLRGYARLLCRRLLSEEVAIVPVLGRLKLLWRDLGHLGELENLARLANAWSDLEGGYETFDYPGATRENFTDLARMEAVKVLEATAD